MSLKAILLWYAVCVNLLVLNAVSVLVGLACLGSEHSGRAILLLLVNTFFTWWSYVNARQLYHQVLDQLPGEPDSWEEQP